MGELSAIQRARLSLEGLSVGDAFGEQFFGEPEQVTAAIHQRQLPKSPWHVTDDTIMALGIVDVLEQYQAIHQDVLARTNLTSLYIDDVDIREHDIRANARGTRFSGASNADH